MIAAVKQLGDQLATDGWRISACRSDDGFDAWLRRNESDQEQFFGHGATMLDAMHDAVAKRDAKSKELAL